MPAEWWEADEIVKPRGGASEEWWKADPITESDKSGQPMSTEAFERAKERGEQQGLEDAGRATIKAAPYVGLAMATAGAGPGLAGGALRLVSDPRVLAAASGVKTLAETGDPLRAVEVAGGTYYGGKFLGKAGEKVIGKVGGWVSKALEARLAHQVARAAAAEAAPVAQTAAAEGAPAAKALTAEMETLLRRATDATAPPKIRQAARVALEKTGWTPEAGMMAEPIAEAAPAAAKAITMPVKGNVKMATVYSRPAGAPPTRSAAPRMLQRTGDEALRAKQLEAAQAAGMDVGEAFGTAPVARQAEQAAESALETRLRASVLMKKNPTALANEIADHIVGLGKVKPERAAEVVQELYGLPPTNARQMVEMVFQAQGWR